jgi:segregation and condensation protein B
MTDDLIVVTEQSEPVVLPDLRAGLEAVLLVVDEPVDEVTLAQVVERPRDEVRAMLQALAADYDHSGRGFELREVAGGWRLYTRASCAPYVERFVREGQPARISQAALETLAVVAYRQPTTRGLIAEVGVERESGAILYETTDHFLDRLGLASLDELPDISAYLPDHSVLDDDAATG